MSDETDLDPLSISPHPGIGEACVCMARGTQVITADETTATTNHTAIRPTLRIRIAWIL
jgi:hypothetical protein